MIPRLTDSFLLVIFVGAAVDRGVGICSGVSGIWEGPLFWNGVVIEVEVEHLRDLVEGDSGAVARIDSDCF